MWSKKRQRYVFRKRSRRGRIFWLLVGTLMLVGLFWFIPWQTLSSVEILDTLKSVASRDQPEQAPVEDQPEQDIAEDQPEQADTQDQPGQGSTTDLPRNEAALEGTPSKEERASNAPVSSSPAAAQLSPPPQTPSIPAVEPVPPNFLPPNDYWYPESESNDYWYSGAGYWDYGDDYYWDY
jgi:hypothetical protein